MNARVIPDTLLFEVFVFLQLLDFLTTLLGMKFGAQEVNPFVRYLMTAGTVEGLIYCKLLMLAGGIAVLWYRRFRIITTLNYIFGAIVVWNLTQILKVPLT